jgi:cytochrome b561
VRRRPALTSERVGYTVTMRTVHWTSAMLLIGSYATAWTISSASTSVEIAELTRIHRSFGLIILTLTAIRLVWRQRERIPQLPPDIPRWQRLAARLNVVGLYGLLFAQPLLGLTASMVHGDRLVLLGGVALPGVLPVNRPLAYLLFEVHGEVALILLGVIGMHVAAALYHHFVRRDDVLVGMLPGAERTLRPSKTRDLTSS